MEESRRSGGEPATVVKNRSSPGCLIVKKKSGVGSSSSGSRKSKKDKKRSSLVMSDSGSSDDELIMQCRRRVGPETIRVCNGLSAHEKGVVDQSEFGRKRSREEEEEDFVSGGEGGSDIKRNKLDVFEFNEYDDVDLMRRATFGHTNSRLDIGGRRLSGSMASGSGGVERKLEARHLEKRTKMYFDRNSHLEESSDSDGPIRVQGKNAILKVMVNNKKKMSGGSSKGKESGRRLRVDNRAKRNVTARSSFNSDTKSVEKPRSSSRTRKKNLNLEKSLSPTDEDSDSESEDSDSSLKLGLKKVEARDSVKRSTPKRINAKISDNDSEDSDDSLLKPEPKNVGARSSKRKVTSSKIKEGKLKRGSGTEKQRLREKIREMLQSAGWTIDYRPRRNRDYIDAVYINPAGTAFWSIIKAYEAFRKQKADEDSDPSAPLSNEILNQLTRNTQKKMEKEMKKKKGKKARGAAKRQASNTGLDEETSDSDSHEDKLSSFMKQGGKSFKGRANEKGSFGVNSKNQSRCTLLVRSTNDCSNSETGSCVSYAGKRTILSWLIDSGTVQSSQKVQYMNRHRTRAMLEGWITGDGIHCGCCSKILTVWKFEIHAGSKLRQPFQNICLDTGVSLLQCQIDAWNGQEESERIGFFPVDSDSDGDDPNDDTCGICGDGGDLICCDGCPSTFHQSCLDIQVLPPGDWHCSNCTCKFCGVANEGISEGGDSVDCAMFSCTLCKKQFHKSCVLDTVDLNCSVPFCGKNCKELFEHLQRYLGVKQELEAGFSWSFVHRTDADADKRGLNQRVENNSKLAVALTVMDECFLPVVDRRSGINVVKNVLYNCGSNFHRLNYSGFYTAVLERGDEIICAASIRFHGTQLAEMPFIGTRHMYRRQGMCHRLFSAIEMALCSLKVEKLVIPAISELAHTWTSVFGFTSLQGASKKEMKSLNMLVFPGIDMLHKLLVKKENETVRQGAKGREINPVTPKEENQVEVNSSAEHDAKECDDDNLCVENETNGEVTTTVSDSKCAVVSSNDNLTSKSTKGSGKENNPLTAEGTAKESDDDDMCVENEINGEVTTTVSDCKDPVVSSNDNLTSDCTEGSGEKGILVTSEGIAKKCDEDNLCVENDINGEVITMVSDCKDPVMFSNDNLSSDCTDGSREKSNPITGEGTASECDDDNLHVENETNDEVTITGSDSKCLVVSPNENLTSELTKGSREENTPVTGEGTSKESNDVDSLCVENEINGDVTTTVSDCKCSVVSSNENLTSGCTEGSGEKSIPVTSEGIAKECDVDNLCVKNAINGEVITMVSDSKCPVVSSNDNLTSDCTEGSGEKCIPVTVEGTVKKCDDNIFCVENEINGEVTSMVSDSKFPVVSSNDNSTSDCTQGSGEKSIPVAGEGIAKEHDTNEINGEVTTMVSDSKCPLVSSNDNLSSNCPEGSGEENISVTGANDDSQPGNNLAEPASSDVKDKSVKPVSGTNCHSNSTIGHGDSPVKDDAGANREVNLDNADAKDLNRASSNEVELQASVETSSQSCDKSTAQE